MVGGGANLNLGIFKIKAKRDPGPKMPSPVKSGLNFCTWPNGSQGLAKGGVLMCNMLQLNMLHHVSVIGLRPFKD